MLGLTVTGLLFLMHPKTEIDSFNKSSIIISEDGFTYCDSEHYPFTTFETITLTEGKSFEEWVLKNKIRNNIQLVIANNAGLFVPSKLFNQKIVNDYYDKFDKRKNSDILKTDITSNHIKSITYKVSSSIISIKENYFKNSNLVHYQTIIYDYLIAKNINEKKLYVNIQTKSIDIFLFFNEQLQLVNRYPNNGVDSFLYFLFFIIEKHELNKNEFFICFLGNYLIFKEYYEGAKLYHNNIKFILAKSQNDINNTPTPFLIDLHAYYFRNS
ncbi:MAG: DUF3822 family protein [Flavobacteriaceae bacterium]|nr:DUF3822 family protein [Flavobacteriaceae bacterium]